MYSFTTSQATSTKLRSVVTQLPHLSPFYMYGESIMTYQHLLSIAVHYNIGNGHNIIGKSYSYSGKKEKNNDLRMNIQGVAAPVYRLKNHLLVALYS